MTKPDPSCTQMMCHGPLRWLAKAPGSLSFRWTRVPRQNVSFVGRAPVGQVGLQGRETGGTNDPGTRVRARSGCAGGK